MKDEKKRQQQDREAKEQAQLMTRQEGACSQNHHSNPNKL